MPKFLPITLSLVSLLGIGIPIHAISISIPRVKSLQLAQLPNCKNPQTQSEMNICASTSYQNADRKLNKIYKQLLPKLSASRKQKLIKAQQAWIKFRDASCEFERSGFEGGTMAPMIYGTCLATVTEKRTLDLEEYLKGEGM